MGPFLSTTLAGAEFSFKIVLLTLPVTETFVAVPSFSRALALLFSNRLLEVEVDLDGTEVRASGGLSAMAIMSARADRDLGSCFLAAGPGAGAEERKGEGGWSSKAAGAEGGTSSASGGRRCELDLAGRDECEVDLEREEEDLEGRGASELDGRGAEEEELD